MDLIRSLAVGEAVTHTLEYTTRRERPDGSGANSFPSGHATDTFAFATALERHLGWRGAVPAYIFFVLRRDVPASRESSFRERRRVWQRRRHHRRADGHSPRPRILHRRRSDCSGWGHARVYQAKRRLTAAFQSLRAACASRSYGARVRTYHSQSTVEHGAGECRKQRSRQGIAKWFGLPTDGGIAEDWRRQGSMRQFRRLRSRLEVAVLALFART